MTIPRAVFDMSDEEFAAHQKQENERLAREAVESRQREAAFKERRERELLASLKKKYEQAP